MRNTLGTPVRQEDFLERAMELRELWHRLTRGHVLMLAPRRVGKTSILLHMRDKPESGWSCIFLSVESLATEAQFVARLITEVCKAHPDGAWGTRFGLSVRRLLQNVGKLDAGPIQLHLAEAMKDDWQDVGATALGVMADLPGNTVLLVDEFPIFVRRLLGNTDESQGLCRTQLFLDWFRETRNAQHGKGRIHFLLTGSLGLDAVVQAVGMSSTINDLDVFRLGPLTAELAEALLDQLTIGEELPLTTAVRQRIHAHIDWPIPFHLQLLFAEILSRVKFRGRTLDEALVDEAYAALLSAENRKHFNHWVERLHEPLLPRVERDLKRALLRAAALDPSGIGRNSILQIRKKVSPETDEGGTLASLEHDGYLTFEEPRWRFTSSLLRDWWLKWQVKRKN